MNGSRQSEQMSSACRQAAESHRASTAWLRNGACFTPAILAVAVLLSLGAADASRSQAMAASYSSAEAAFWGEIRSSRREHRPSKGAKGAKTSVTPPHHAPQANDGP